MTHSQFLYRATLPQFSDRSTCRPLLAVLIAAILGGCSSFKGPDRLEIPGNTSEFRSRLYTGASIGSSRLTPDTRQTAFNGESDGDAGTQLRLGYDVHNMLAVELDTSVLGAADLREFNTDVKYSAAAISALVYGLSGVQMRSRREGLSAYARLGYGALKKSSAVLVLEESGMVPIIGLGAEYGFSNGLGLRGEITRFDGDASYIGLGAIYRFGLSPAGIGTVIAQAAEPALGAAHTTVAEDGRILTGSANNRFNPLFSRDSEPTKQDTTTVQQFDSANVRSGGDVNTVEDRWRPAMRDGDRDIDGVLDQFDNCKNTASYVTVDRHGCGLFDAVLEDVTFKSGSRWLSPRARGQLDHVADTLLAFPESRVQVRAHTDAIGAADMNLSLSSRRAETVVQYLLSRGVNELQLQGAGIGEAQPLDSNGSAVGRRRNRRVDLVTLPDLDAGQLLVASSVNSTRVISVSDAAQIEPMRDSYQHAKNKASELWNSRGENAGKLTAKAPDHDIEAEPGLQSANPGASATPSASSTESSLQSTVEALVKSPAIQPLPVPGIAQGLAIAGVVEGLGFPQGKSTLTPAGQAALQPLLAVLKANQAVSIAVMAHTDDRGEADANLALSRDRADAVVEHLSVSGIDKSRMNSEGYGELLPLMQNVTEDDRMRNRRIEIRVLPNPE